MFDPPVVADIISARLALHKMLYSSPDKSVYCPPGLADSESSDGDIIHSSWQNDTPGESMYPIQCRGRGKNYSIKAKSSAYEIPTWSIFSRKEHSDGSGI